MNLLDDVFQDARFAARQFRANWIFTSTAIVVLALGMAASVAIFAFVDAALIKPLPYQNPARLVGVLDPSRSLRRPTSPTPITSTSRNSIRPSVRSTFIKATAT